MKIAIKKKLILNLKTLTSRSLQACTLSRYLTTTVNIKVKN